LNSDRKKSRFASDSAARLTAQAIDRPAFSPLDPALGLSPERRHFLNPIREFFDRPSTHRRTERNHREITVDRLNSYRMGIILSSAAART
jgi:hypothetical protein